MHYLSVRHSSLFQIYLDDTQQVIATELLKEIRSRLQFLDQVGLGYLALIKAPTLSGGESQRIRLAAQIGSGLSGVLYVLDDHQLACTLETTSNCLEPLKRFEIRETQLLLLSMTKRRSVLPTGWLILDQAQANVVARWLQPARRRH